MDEHSINLVIHDAILITSFCNPKSRKLVILNLENITNWIFRNVSDSNEADVTVECVSSWTVACLVEESFHVNVTPSSCVLSHTTTLSTFEQRTDCIFVSTSSIKWNSKIRSHYLRLTEERLWILVEQILNFKDKQTICFI